MKDKFDEMVAGINFDDDEFEEFEEDFDAKNAHYDIYIYNYDADQNIMDENTLFMSFAEPEGAINKAKELVADLETLRRLAAKDAAFVSIEVETTVECEDAVENVGTLFVEVVEL